MRRAPDGKEFGKTMHQQQATDLAALLRTHGRRKSANQTAAKIPFNLLNRVIKHLEEAQ